MRLLEIHDRPWFPEFLRREVVDGLQVVLEATGAYLPVAPRLREALDRAARIECWILFPAPEGLGRRSSAFSRKRGRRLPEVYLTDKYPDTAKCATAEPPADQIHFVSEPVDATQIPEGVPGFRTIFSSFHHFNSGEARRFLQDSAGKLRGVGIFEVASGQAITLISILFMPIVVWLFAPLRQPFRWSRLLWTYMIPIVPFVLLFDGLRSCLRTYSLADLRNLTDGLTTEDYKWEIGEENGGWLPVRITYLIGCPKKLPAVRANWKGTRTSARP